MKTSLIALFVLGCAAPAFAGERINFQAEKVPTYRAEKIARSKDLFTVHSQVKFKNGELGRVNVHTHSYSDHPVKYEVLGDAEMKQAQLMKSMEEYKKTHNKQNFEFPQKQISEIHTWIEKEVKTWTDTEREKD